MILLIQFPLNAADKYTNFSLSSLEKARANGKTVVVNSYEPWCWSCRKQDKVLLGAKDEFKDVVFLTFQQGKHKDIAEELIIDQATASQKMYNDVKTEIGLMMLGNEATYVENDPAAKTKMQYAQDIVSRNPKAQSALQGDEVFQQLFENYSKNLQMSIMQEENKTVGRIGVSQLT